MQTFLAYPNIYKSAEVLDMKRLGKQRVETWQILRALTDPTAGWKNHPATKMWRGHEAALCSYGIAICQEWRARGYKDTMLERFIDTCCDLIDNGASPDMPEWFGNEEFHASHRSNLLRKDPEWYGQFHWTEPDNLEYVWPAPLDTELATV